MVQLSALFVYFGFKNKAMATTLKTGDIAPEFSGVDQNGKSVSLSGLRGRRVILYFYPKDNTSGCTAEACSLRDGYTDLAEMGFEIIGVSPDSAQSHLKFAQKHNLNFHLLPDTDKSILNAYGTWGEKKMYGRTSMGVIRTTFIIGADGRIEHVVGKVDTKNHAEQIKNLVAGK